MSVTVWDNGLGVGMQVAEAVRVLLPEFNEIDGMVATNINRVLDAYAHARIGSHVRTSLPFFCSTLKLHKFCGEFLCLRLCLGLHLQTKPCIKERRCGIERLLAGG